MKLNHVTVPVSDVERASVFYEALGLKPIVRALPHYVRFVCPDGENSFSLDLEPEQAGRGGSIVYFECEDLDARCAALAAAGVAFDQPPTSQPWLWREARLRDPDGNRLCLFFAGKSRLDPPWRLPESR
jgi:catechol 2,3-dioxygenase-like lactoylglutathione lyase family enzyme